jgi:hypothetical protein
MSDNDKLLFKWLSFSKDQKEREERAHAGMKKDDKSNLQEIDSRSKMQKQEDAIIEILKRESYDPLGLPPYRAGKDGSNVKGLVAERALRITKLFTKSSFVNAWERMRKEGTLKDR